MDSNQEINSSVRLKLLLLRLAIAAEAYKSDFNVPVLSAPDYTPVNQVSDSESEYFLVSQPLTKKGSVHFA